MRIRLSLLAALLVALMPCAGHASPVSGSYAYTFDLNPNSNQPYGGWAKITLNTAIPNSNSITTMTGDILSLTFVIDYNGVLKQFNTANPSTVVIQVKNGQIYDLTQSTTIGTGTSAFTLSSTSTYTFYYYSGSPLRSTQDHGTFADLAPSPEPSSLALLGTAAAGALAFAGFRRRGVSAL